MKQLLFLLLFPCLALAQYQGNANQKITLGEQTTADGLVWRGIRADTTSKIVPFSDTSAYIILDTVEKTLWLYKAGQVPKWQQVGGSTLDTATMLLPYYRAGRNTIIQAADVPTLNQNTTGSAATLTTGRTIQTNLALTSSASFNGSANITPGVTGVLPVANGGTGSATQNFVDLTTNQSIGGAKTFSNAINVNGTITSGNSGGVAGNFALKRASDGLTVANYNIDETNSIAKLTTAYSFLTFSTEGTERMRLNNNNFGINNSSPTENLHVGGTIASGRSGGVAGNFALKRASDGLTVANYNIDETNGITKLSTEYSLLTFLTEGTERMRLNNNELRIGYTTDQGSYRLQVQDSVYVGGNVSASAYTTRSDYDLKDEIQNISYGINEVMQMQPVKYTYKSNGSSQLGFIAQDLGVITPEVVSFEDKMSVYYNALIPILTKAIQEQNALIKALEQRILILENK